MRFYFVSIFSEMFLALIYLVGTALLVWFGLWLRKRWKRAWMVMVPLFLLLYIAPVAEEFWIAWNFGRLCKKDAGLFVYKTVEVDGFYDDTHTWTERRMNDPAEPRFLFMEGRGQIYGKDTYWRHERVGGAIRSFKIERPTAKYHYERDIYGTRAAHKITRQEARITDSASGEVVGRYVEYGRQPYWFFVGLDKYPFSCDGPDGGPTSKHISLIYRIVLKPSK